MAGYKLVYFDIRGRGELVRLLFTHAGVEFEDERVERGKWPTVKPTTPFGQVPILEFGGKRYTQSIAIANYLAREFKLYGGSNLESFKIDEVVGLCQDFFQSFCKIFLGPEDKKEELQETVKDEDIPKFLTFFETLLKESGTGYFVGHAITLADLAVFDTLEYVVRVDADALKKFPLVDANRQKVASQDKIAAYVKTRKDTPM